MAMGAVLGGTAIIGVLTGFWKHIMILWSKISGLIIIKIQLQDMAASAMNRNLIEEWFPLDSGVKKIGGETYYVRPQRRSLVVGLRHAPESCLWYRNRKIIFSSGDPYSRTIYYIRGMFKYKELVQDVIDLHNTEYKTKRDRYDVINYYGDSYDKGEQAATVESDAPCGPVDKFNSYPLRWDRDDLGYKTNSDDPFDTLYYSVDVNALISEIELWLNNGEWFKDRMIPWKRGYMLYGKPGTGKTVFVRSIAQKLKIPICTIDLSTMTNDELIRKWNSITSKAPCVVLFEDLDAVFHGRKNVACEGNMERGLTFDCLLNVIDGVKASDGILTFITTNDISKLDPALGNPNNGDCMSTRPGRIDKVIELGNLSKEHKVLMSNNILGCFERSLWENNLPLDKDDSPAQFQERCSRIAIKLWENENKRK